MVVKILKCYFYLGVNKGIIMEAHHMYPVAYLGHPCTWTVGVNSEEKN